MVDLGLPSGVLWAKKNIDLTQTDHFTASEYQYACSYFSWGNMDGYNPISDSAFSYDWGASNSGTYNSTKGRLLTCNIPLSQDAARVSLGAPYRIPTVEEFIELFNNCHCLDNNGNIATGYVRVTVNGIVGVHLQSKHNGNRIFLPAAGFGKDTAWNNYSEQGAYWSSSLNTDEIGNALFFNDGAWTISSQFFGPRYHGFAIRPVV